MLIVDDKIAIPDGEINERFIHASGPGGQHVNKVATCVQLRFDVANSPSLPDDVRRRLMAKAGSRITTDGILIIKVDQHRSREQNRKEARRRLVEWIRKAGKKNKRRIPSRPTQASKRRRLEEKRRRSRLKKLRRIRSNDF